MDQINGKNPEGLSPNINMFDRSDSSFTSQYLDKCLIYNAFKYRCNGRCWNARCSGCGFDANPSTLFQTAPEVVASVQSSLILQIHLYLLLVIHLLVKPTLE